MADIPPVTTWAVAGGALYVWQSGKPIGRIPIEQFPALIEALARGMRNPMPGDDPAFPFE